MKSKADNISAELKSLMEQHTKKLAMLLTSQYPEVALPLKQEVI